MDNFVQEVKEVDEIKIEEEDVTPYTFPDDPLANTQQTPSCEAG